VWVVETNGRIRFYGEEEMDASEVAPGCPNEV